MRRCSPPTFACWLLASVVPAPLSRGYARRPHRRIHSSRRICFARRCVTMVLESSLSFCPVDGLVLAAKPGLAYQYEHRDGRVHHHGNAQVCRRLDHLEVRCPAANDIRHSCADCVSRDHLNRRLRRGANSSRRNDISRINRNDYGCRFDRGKGLHNTGTVVVSVWLSYSRTSVGVTHTGGIWGAQTHLLTDLPP
jgi:hypothetical protein